MFMSQKRGTVTDRLLNVIQVLQLGKKTGHLTVERDEGKGQEKGEIIFVEGQVTQAYGGNLRGQEALNWLSTWGACRFIFVAAAPEKTTSPFTTPPFMSSPKATPKGEKQMTDKKLFTTIDEYISTFPAHIQVILEKVRQAIHKAAPEVVETMSYAIPTFDLNGKHVVFFAGWKHHLSLYPLPAGDEAFQQTIVHYKRAKGSIQFPFDKPIPYDLVEQIVTLLREETPEK